MAIVEQSLLPQRLILEFFGEPRAVQSTRFTTEPYIDKNGNKRFTYTDQNVKSWKESIRWQAIQQVGQSFVLLDGPIHLIATFIFLPPQKFA